MITDEDRQRVSRMALEALDAIEERYGEDAEFQDALLLVEVSLPRAEDMDIDIERYTELLARSTTERSMVLAGLCATYLADLVGGFG